MKTKSRLCLLDSSDSFLLLSETDLGLARPVGTLWAELSRSTNWLGKIARSQSLHIHFERSLSGLNPRSFEVTNLSLLSDVVGPLPLTPIGSKTRIEKAARDSRGSHHIYKYR